MSKSLNSPTARLLQSSRLFSLPRPLPQPALETPTSTGIYRASDSATTPYPTYQAIATPASSHFRGDWGLKRPLPAKSTKKGTPHIRVKAHDNFAHITDFESAADHTQTEAKWRQMGVPMVLRERTRDSYTDDNKRLHSAYDDSVDNTDPEANYNSANRRRWKHKGPWISGMQQGEFEIYVESRLKSRRGEFRQFMIKRLAHQQVQEEERKLRDLGQRQSLSRSRRTAILQEVTGNYEAEEKRLRDEHATQHLASELTAAICDFLDLPAVRGSSDNRAQVKTPAMRGVLDYSEPEESAPPSTHPGAGVSHLRTNAVMENHPFWGPQGHSSPVLARVIRPRNTSQATDHQAKLGVGGIVANDKSMAQERGSSVGSGWPGTELPADEEAQEIERQHLDADRMTSHLEVDLPGGNKIWVHPEMASVDEDGRIRLLVNRGEKEAIAVARNDVEAIHQAKSASLSATTRSSSPGTAGNANYGYGLPDQRYAAGRSRVQGFDEQLSGRPQRGQRDWDENEALESIKQLAREKR